MNPGLRTAAAILLLLLSTTVAEGEPRFDFGLSGSVTILKATEWVDGGSVTVMVQDENGREARVRGVDSAAN
jgi:hypothetical protein